MWKMTVHFEPFYIRDSNTLLLAAPFKVHLANMARGSSSRSHRMAGDRLGRHARAAPRPAFSHQSSGCGQMRT
ncbi:hypothetical protein V8C26DRAFT_271898 [Trichoderma gracile]